MIPRILGQTSERKIFLSDEAFSLLKQHAHLAMPKPGLRNRELSLAGHGGYYTETTPPLPTTPDLSHAVCSIPYLTSLDPTRWLDTRPAPYKQHDHIILRTGRLLDFNNGGGALDGDTGKGPNRLAGYYYLPRYVQLTDTAHRFYAALATLHNVAPLSPLHKGVATHVSSVLEAIALQYLSPPPPHISFQLPRLMKEIRSARNIQEVMYH